MAKTFVPAHIVTWGKPGRGKFHKRQYNRAARRAAKGTGKTRAVARAASEIAYGKHYPGRSWGKS